MTPHTPSFHVNISPKRKQRNYEIAMAEDPEFSVRSSLSIDRDDNDVSESGGDLDVGDSVPQRTKILSVVKSCPDYTIRPARLSQELGISVTDASAELCGLLKAVGKGSTFRFEKTGGVHTMVFTFPPDFEVKALSAQRADDWKQSLQSGFQVMVKVLKMLTAFGLILSTIIVSIAGMLALLAAFVAISRGGDSRQRHHITRQLHNTFLMVRQLLWCYAMFGPEGDNDQDPFFREAAYDTSLILSICCGNPMSMWFWWRASILRRRRRRIARGWGRMSSLSDYGDSPADLEGIRLIRRGDRGQTETLPVSGSEHRGLLSVAVEFLFGPTKPPGPLEADRWRLRSAVILEKSQQSKSSSIALQDLSPFMDSPPKSLNDTSKLVPEGLLVVAYFNGVPAADKSDVSSTKQDTDLAKAQFVFPELLAESTHSVGRYDDPAAIHQGTPGEQSSRWSGLFYEKDEGSHTTPGSRTGGLSNSTPPFLHEQRMVFTSLASKQFYHCLLVAILNAIGVVWFAQSLEVGGVLEQFLAPGVVVGLQWALIPVLIFYAKLFFTIPAVRLLYILVWNELCMRRNQCRSHLASQLGAEQQPMDKESALDPNNGGVEPTVVAL